MKKLIAIILTVGLVASLLAACASTGGNTSEATTKAASGETQAAAEGDTEAEAVDTTGMGEEVTMILSFDTPTLDPFSGQSGGLKYTFNTLYETLGTMDQRGEDLTLIIAKSVEKVADKEYDIEIWDNVYDTAGNHITAEDVVWCYDQAYNAKVYGNFLGAYDHMEQTGDYTLKLYMTTDAVGGLMSTFEGIPIVSKAGYEADPESYIQHPAGTVGYVVTDFQEGYGWSVEYVGTWHEEGQAENISCSANVKKINYIYISESSQVRMALENGDAQVAYSVSTDDLSVFQNSDDFKVNETYDNRLIQIMFNCKTTDVHLRRACAYAINRDEMNEFLYNGKGKIANSACGVSLLDYNPEWDEEDYYDYSVEKAKEELAQSSYNGETLKILCTVASDNKKGAELVVTYLAAIGVNATVTPVEDSVIDSTAEDPTAFDLYYTPRGAEDYMVNMWKHWCPASRFNGTTQGFAEDDRLQELYDLMLDENTHTQEIVDEAHELCKEQVYVYGLFQGPSYCVYDSNMISDIALNYKAYPLPNAFTYNY